MSGGGGAILLIIGLVLVLIFVPSMRRVALMSFVASVVYQVVRTLFRGRR